jgi:hypothetical protein
MFSKFHRYIVQSKIIYIQINNNKTLNLYNYRQYLQETAERVPLRIQGASHKRTGHADRIINDRCLHQKILFQHILTQNT